MMEKTLAGECEALIISIRAFIAVFLREIKKPLLKFCKILDAMIDHFEGV